MSDGAASTRQLRRPGLVLPRPKLAGKPHRCHTEGAMRRKRPEWGGKGPNVVLEHGSVAHPRQVARPETQRRRQGTIENEGLRSAQGRVPDTGDSPASGETAQLRTLDP